MGKKNHRKKQRSKNDTQENEPMNYRALIENSGYTITSYLGGNKRNSGIIKNPKWECIKDNVEHILMICSDTYLCILCKESLAKIREFELVHNNGYIATWYRVNTGYISTAMNNGIESITISIHQAITGVFGNGRGTAKVSIDHIDRNPLNNRLDNLRIADRKTQEQNSKGIAPGTKRERQSNARPLPEGITHDMLRKYVVYYLNTYNKEKGLTREYFTVEHHPLLERPWESSKSKEVSIMDKLAAANKVAEDLDKGILPTKPERTLPKYFRFGIRNGQTAITFERRTKECRYNTEYLVPEDEDFQESLKKIQENIAAKYGSNVWM